MPAAWTEFECTLQELVEANISRNCDAICASGGQASFSELAWGVTDVDTLRLPSNLLVIAADVVYHQELYKPLCSTLARLGMSCRSPGESWFPVRCWLDLGSV